MGKRSVRGRVAALLTIVLVVTVVPVAGSAPAQAQAPVDVRVQVSGTQTYQIKDIDYGLRITGATQALPADVRVEGRAECTHVWSGPGYEGTAIPTWGNDFADKLQGGVWYFVPNSCRSTAHDPVHIVGSGGPYRIILQGGPLTVTRWRTGLETTAFISYENGDPDRPVVTLGARLTTGEFDVPDADIVWDYEIGTGGTTCTGPGCIAGVVQGCTAKTTRDPTSDWRINPAVCVLTGQRAREFVAGTGFYTAFFMGDRNFEPVGEAGLVAGTTGDPSTAGELLVSMYHAEPVEITQTAIPPGCGLPPPSAQASLGSLVTPMDCKALKVAKILSGIAIAVVLAVTGGAALAMMAETTALQIAGTVLLPTAIAALQAKQVGMVAFLIASTVTYVAGNIALFGKSFSRPT